MNGFASKSPEQHPLAAGLPGQFAEEQVIYRELGLEPDGAYRYVAIDRPTATVNNPAYTTIEDFVGTVTASGYVRNDPDLEEVKYLDITVSRPSYILVHLSSRLSWYFSSGNPGITLGARASGHPDPDTLYGRLRYVDDGGHIHDAPSAQCRLAYFAAMPVLGTPESPYLRSLNFNVEVAGGTLVVIDPDIRYPGNGSS